jgi:hypothetical protein
LSRFSKAPDKQFDEASVGSSITIELEMISM